MPSRAPSQKTPPHRHPATSIPQLSPAQVRAFRNKVYRHYDTQGRDLPWRKRVTPYRVLVSEIMLQQTQVDRVVGKYREFLAAFPDLPSLAKAPTARLLRIWSGMGYNRRALALRSLAQQVMAGHRGRLPSDPELLRKLPGIGPYTAGAVAAFAFNRPVIFLDTNVRRVFLHEFFPGREQVRDDELIPLIERCLDAANPRKWYNALMDYGTMLKQEHGNPNVRSAHYTRQSPFENSNRQVRGAVLKLLVARGMLTAGQLVRSTGMDPARIETNLARLTAEGFIVRRRGRYRIE